ncbi:MAG: cysteine hydrolase family protein [Acidimicrobiales bacterium]
MPVDLAVVAAPAHTAVLTMELQRGVCGDLATLPHLRDAVASRGVVAATADLLRAARTHGVRVVHCTVAYRADRAGTPTNAPLLSALARDGSGNITEGSPNADLLPDLGADPGDVVESRRHGLSPFAGTSLDSTLRGLGVSTVVATGASINVGIFGLAIEAVNLGYRVVVPTDAVVGVPPEYGDTLLANSIGLLATLTSTDALKTAWAG